MWASHGDFDMHVPKPTLGQSRDGAHQSALPQIFRGICRSLKFKNYCLGFPSSKCSPGNKYHGPRLESWYNAEHHSIPPKTLNENLYLNRSPWKFMCILKIEKCWSSPVQWLIPAIPAAWEAEIGKITVQYQSGQIVLQGNQGKMDWRRSSSSRAPALQVQSPELKLQLHQKSAGLDYFIWHSKCTFFKCFSWLHFDSRRGFLPILGND
jgi:hypothetical protein